MSEYNFRSAIVRITFVVLGIGALYWFFGIFLAADKSVQASIIAATAAIFGIVFTYWKERSRSIKEAHREQKIEAYKIYHEMVFGMIDKLNSVKDLKASIEPSQDPEFENHWIELRRKVVFYGSPQVLNTLSQFTLHAPDPSDPKASMRKAGAVFLAMRDDIGLSNSGLNELSIHQIYVTDDLSK